MALFALARNKTINTKERVSPEPERQAAKTAGCRRSSLRPPNILKLGRYCDASVGAKHLILHTHGGAAHPGLWRIKTSGPRLFTAEELLKLDYPKELDAKPDAIYAVYDVEQDEAYEGWQWDYTSLQGKKSGRQSAKPFAVTLTEVLAVQKVR